MKRLFQPKTHHNSTCGILQQNVNQHYCCLGFKEFTVHSL